MDPHRPPAIETWTTRWKRRALTFSAVAVLGPLVWACLPFLVVLAALTDAVRHSRWAAVRMVLLWAGYLGLEWYGLFLGLCSWLWTRGPDFIDQQDRIQSHWAGLLHALIHRVLDKPPVIDGLGCLDRGGALVFMRHTSQLDTLLPAQLLGRKRGLLLRTVLKQDLLLDPAIDLVGQRMKNAYLSRGRAPEDDLARLRWLLTDLTDNDVIIYYPEGTRFGQEKKEALIARLEQKGETALADYTRTLRHVLPPRLGGSLHLLEHNTNADVVFVAHIGYEGCGSPADFLNGRAVGSEVLTHGWRVPFDELPTDTESRTTWLFDQWQQLDDWVHTQLSERSG